MKQRSKLIRFLNKNNIQTSIHYPKILSEVPALKKITGKNSIITAKQNSKKIISLPIGEHLNETQIKIICKLINKFYNHTT